MDLEKPSCMFKLSVILLLSVQIFWKRCTNGYRWDPTVGETIFFTCPISGRIPDCQATQKCPPEYRFCTPVGCVSQCPEHSFQNGTMCVVTCGDLFVVNNTCRSACPTSKSLTVEDISLMNGMFIKVRSCVNACREHDPGLLEYGGECVPQCPQEAQFIIENSCRKRCPKIYPYLLEYNRNGKRVTECIKSCPTNSPYIRDERTCVRMCPSTHKFVLNDTCVAQCTDEMPFFMNIIGNLHCRRSCETLFHLGRECVNKCDQSYHLSDNTCVKTCPSTQPFIERQRIVIDTKGRTYHGTVCVTECSEYRLEQTFDCVSRCPDGSHLFNRTCVARCPDSTPYSHKECVNCESWKYEYVGSMYENRCHQQCPDNTFTLNFTCLETCTHFLFNGECVLNCPIPINDTRFDGTTCGYCGLLDTSSDSCMEACPRLRPYNENGVCVKNCSHGMIAYDFKCVDEHNCNTSIQYNGQCLDSCPEGMYWYSGKCFLYSNLQTQLILSFVGLVLIILFGFCCCRCEPWNMCCTYVRKWNAYEILPIIEMSGSFDGASRIV